MSDALHSRHCLLRVCWAVCALGFVGYTALSWFLRQCLGLFFLLHCSGSQFTAVFSCFCLFRTAPFAFSDGSKAVCLMHFTLGTALCGYVRQCVLLASLVTLPSVGCFGAEPRAIYCILVVQWWENVQRSRESGFAG